MRADSLDLRELFHFASTGGVLHFAGQRALIFDAVALGLLRKELIDALGAAGARAILTRLGYAHGWRVAETLRRELAWDDETEWKRAGGRLHMLQGHVVVDPAVPARAPGDAPLAESIWHDSYEAEQHLLHVGRTDEPVCWTLTGFASGYLSFANGREVYCIEHRCRAEGDAVCHMVARYREDWDESIQPHLAFYRHEAIGAALEHVTAELKKMERQIRRRKQALPGKGAEDPSGIIAASPAMRRTLDLARRVAKVDSTVIVSGESGSGKERVARLIHDESARTAGPFVAVNCGAMAETMLESELFGHVKGAFTGASHDRAGLFEAATGGTLFLDEIGEISPAMQVKLLRVLQEREIRRLGENRVRKIDVRVLAATHRDLAAEVAEGRFREDLYYRLRVMEIVVPPLRERRDDILPLARTFLAEAAARAGRKIAGFTPRAAGHLLRNAWPGNVRELQNTMERVVILTSSDRITERDAVEATGQPLTAPSRDRTLESVEREHIESVLRSVAGNRARAAEQLGIGIATLYRKLRQYRS